MFAKTPVLAIYKTDVGLIKKEKDFYLNTLLSNDGKLHSFRCPNKECGRPVKIGYPLCPFCRMRLKWEYPFEIIEVD